MDFPLPVCYVAIHLITTGIKQAVWKHYHKHDDYLPHCWYSLRTSGRCNTRQVSIPPPHIFITNTKMSFGPVALMTVKKIQQTSLWKSVKSDLISGTVFKALLHLAENLLWNLFSLFAVDSSSKACQGFLSGFQCPLMLLFCLPQSLVWLGLYVD